jgi:hypothetical protein
MTVTLAAPLVLHLAQLYAAAKGARGAAVAAASAADRAQASYDAALAVVRHALGVPDDAPARIDLDAGTLSTDEPAP